MKRIAALLLAVVLLLSFLGCSSQAAPVKATETAPATAPKATEAVPTTAAATVPTASASETPEETKPEVDEAALPYDYETVDGLMRITLPNRSWVQLYSDEYDILFSDGHCAIALDLYKATDSLPSVPTADQNYKLIFTSALSAGEYVLYIIGFAHEEVDFPDLAIAIGSISIDKDRIAELLPEEEDPEDVYSVHDTNYTAWVAATVLNVRAGAGTDNAILCQLTQDTKLTVTGEVLKGSDYIGWSRVRLANGTTGYVFSQFLTITKPTPRPTKTGNSVVLYSIRGSVYELFEYTDYQWRTESGTVFWPAGFSTWENASGTVLYDYDPTIPEEPDPELTDERVLLYSANGSVTQYVYHATNGNWYNTSWILFVPQGNGIWLSGGAPWYDYDPTVPSGPPENWQDVFATSLWAHDGMVPVEYTYICDGIYSVLCKDPDTEATKTVVVDAYTGSWQ